MPARIISPQSVNHYVWHFLDGVQDRIDQDLVISALRETCAEEEDSPPPEELYTEHEAATLNAVLHAEEVLGAAARAARKVFSDPYDQEEATSHAILKIYRKASLIAAADNPVAYATTTAKRAVADFWRAEKRRKQNGDIPLAAIGEEEAEDEE